MTRRNYTGNTKKNKTLLISPLAALLKKVISGDFKIKSL